MIIEEYDAKSLVRTTKTSLFSWAEVYLNPYQGCEHDCVYCDGKAEGYYMHNDFGQRIRVKKNAPELLENYLKKQDYKTMSLVVDSANEAALKLYEKYKFAKGWQRITHAWKEDNEG